MPTEPPLLLSVQTELAIFKDGLTTCASAVMIIMKFDCR